MKRMHNTYLKTIVVLIIATIVLGVVPFKGNTQEPTVFVIIEYMKVKQGDESKYVEVEKDIWKPIHQERINQGKIIGWYLYQIKYTGANDEYNFATATVFDNTANLENPFDGIDPEKIHPGMNVDEAMEKTSVSRKLVKSQLIKREDMAYPENSMGPSPSKFLQVNYMKVKPNSGYLNVAKTIWKPILQEHINAGSRNGWTLWSTVFPRGFGEDFQYATVDYYSDFSKIGSGNFQEAFKKAHPGKDVGELMKQSRESRTNVRTELWEIIDMVMKEQ